MDTFRKQHPGVIGYTYWGYRHGGRATNKGIQPTNLISFVKLYLASHQSQLFLYMSYTTPLMKDISLVPMIFHFTPYVVINSIYKDHLPARFFYCHLSVIMLGMLTMHLQKYKDSPSHWPCDRMAAGLLPCVRILGR